MKTKIFQLRTAVRKWKKSQIFQFHTAVWKDRYGKRPARFILRSFDFDLKFSNLKSYPKRKFNKIINALISELNLLNEIDKLKNISYHFINYKLSFQLYLKF